MGSNEDRFNVLLILGRDKVTVKDSVHKLQLSEEKGELKRNGTEVFLLTCLAPYR